ncbi:hypothetical protein [Aliivibrio logei]|uniref:hypothetical protein n=1 Tax=Aliivibrio logei TaxID=688 RepID=UPI0003A2C555|nr:hypothetical protein [Aliivibrio logei]
MSIATIANLYKIANNVSFSGEHFSGSLLTSQENILALRECGSSDFGRIVDLEQNGEIVEDISDVITNDGILQFKYKIKQNSANKFYQDASSLLSSCDLVKQGHLPSQCYLVNDNCLLPSDDNNSVTAELLSKKLDNICLFIKSLSELAHYHDSKSSSSNSHTLVFLSNDFEIPKPIVIDVIPTEDLLDADLSDLSILTSLVGEKVEMDSHHSARINILSSSLKEFLQGVPPSLAFSKLALNWTAFAKVYQKNYGTYLSGFAFHKVKKDIAESEIKIAEELSKITSDITSKLLSIPVSLAAVITMVTAKKANLYADIFTTLGLIIVTIIIIGLVNNQRAKLDSVKNAKELTLGSFEGEEKNYPIELSEAITKFDINLTNNIKLAEKWLFSFELLSFLPVLSALLVMCFQAY